jgi:hypothetical protein
MNTNIDLNALIQNLNKTKITRKVNMNDLFDNYELDKPSKKTNNIDKIRKYRMQGEFGTKKFIKP